jgi:protein-S-isoprenylcysteine O-methyltransferase Ste14
MIVAGAIINLLGRVQLKGNWTNHIKIYESHSLVNRGIYNVVRHPLYASIMLMLFGGSVAYRNWLSAALTAFVFIPFMYYRAKQEEVLLLEEFTEYVEYKKTTGMFLPKLWR